MGKIADRFANKKHPLFPKAKELTSLLLRSMDSSFAYQHIGEQFDTLDRLSDYIETLLQTLNPIQFRTVIELALELVEPHPNASNLEDELVQTVTETCEIRNRDNGTRGHLVAIPLIVESDSSAIALDDAQQHALTELLRQIEVVHENSEVTYLPSLVPAWSAVSLEFGDIYKLSCSLENKDFKAAIDSLTSATKAKEAGGEKNMWVATGTKRCMVLVAMVGAVDDVPFPLCELRTREKMEVFNTFEDENEEIPKSLALETQDALNAVDKEVQEVLHSISPQLTELLNVKVARIIDIKEDWMSGAPCAMLKQRSFSIDAQLATILDKAKLQSASDVVISTDVEPIGGASRGFAIDILDKSANKKIGSLKWHALPYEEPEQCAASIARYLTERKDLLAAIDTAEALQHTVQVPGTRLLH